MTTIADIVNEALDLQIKGKRVSRILFSPDGFKEIVLKDQALTAMGTFPKQPTTLGGYAYYLDGFQREPYIIACHSADAIREKLRAMAEKYPHTSAWRELADHATDEELFTFDEMWED